MKQIDTRFSHKYKFKNGLFVRLTQIIYTDDDQSHLDMEMGPPGASEEEFERLYYSQEFRRALSHYQEEYEKFLREHYPKRYAQGQA